MKKKYVVNLNDTQRQVLRDCVEKGRSSAYKIRHAHILLKAMRRVLVGRMLRYPKRLGVVLRRFTMCVVVL